MNVGIWGSTGFLGAELVKILSQRQDTKIVYTVTSKKTTGKIEDVETAFLALRAEHSIEIVPELLKRGIKVIDLSGAFRINNLSDFAKYYEFNHTHPELISMAVYGLPEINREKIKNAQFIANPGCYATAALLGLLPLSQNKLLVGREIEIDAASGYSGAGRNKPAPKFSFSYKSDRQHQHVPEIEQILDIPDQLHFFPETTPLFRGMICYIYIDMQIKEKELIELYQDFYKNELFIKIISREERAKRGYDLKSQFDAVAETNICEISVGICNGYVKIVSLIDNLGKGGAGQAMQNFNILYGFPEK